MGLIRWIHIKFVDTECRLRHFDRCVAILCLPHVIICYLSIIYDFMPVLIVVFSAAIQGGERFAVD